jgi:hypothetical protein
MMLLRDAVAKHGIRSDTVLIAKLLQPQGNAVFIIDWAYSIGMTMTETKSSPSPTPKGPHVEMNENALLKFLEGEMTDTTKFNSFPRILVERELAFKLSGRDAAITQAAQCIANLSISPITTARADRRIPVCSGLSGLGKTRMLEEWEQIFDKAEIGPHRLGILVPYYNGFSNVLVENSMDIEASFAWRLLYRCFLYNNSVVFTKWMQTRLPSNAAEINLQLALDVIRLKWGQMNPSLQDEVLHIFVGIDEYQCINSIRGVKGSNEFLLQDLVDAIGNVLAAENRSFKLYPMMAGTDVSAVTILSNSKTETISMPMNLLKFADITAIISSVENGDRLLRHESVRRHLFYLGGVPRWAIEYVSPLLKILRESRELRFDDDIKPSYESIYSRFAGRMLEPFNLKDLIKLAAYALSGSFVKLSESPVAGIRWSKLRDQSVCIIDSQKKVMIPYIVLRHLATYSLKKVEDEASKCFLKCVKDLVKNVDDQVFNQEAWRLWEKFGAYFHALRINALLIIEQEDVTVYDLFNCALINCSVTQKLVLRPTVVIQSRDDLDSRTTAEVGLVGEPSEKHNWIDEGCIVLNGFAGRGVDVFFALKTVTGITVVFLDQGKRVAGPTLNSASVRPLIDHTRLKLNFLPEDSIVVACFFSCLVSANVESEKLPSNSIVVSKQNLENYHGSLFTHPAAAPFVDINNDRITYIKMVLEGNSGDVGKVAERIVARRNFKQLEELRTFISTTNPNVRLKTNGNYIIVFTG